MAIVYVYPRGKQVSFSLIAEWHIKGLKREFAVTEYDETELGTLRADRGDIVILHPLFYLVHKYRDGYARLLRLKKEKGIKLVGVDVADSDRISEWARQVCSNCDAVIVPSEWAKTVYENSGVETPIYVVHHALFPEFLSSKPSSYIYLFRDLVKAKSEKEVVLTLFICHHSPHRKGADLVREVLRKAVARERRILPVFHGVHARLLTRSVRGVVAWRGNTYYIPRKLLAALYDICDIYLLFSRGGGFELCGLEALARGEVVLAPEEGPWTEYLPPESLVKVARREKVLHSNVVHVGHGPVIDVDDAVEKLLTIAQEIDYWREKYAEYGEKIRKEWTWERTWRELLSAIAEVQCL